MADINTRQRPVPVLRHREGPPRPENRGPICHFCRRSGIKLGSHLELRRSAQFATSTGDNGRQIAGYFVTPAKIVSALSVCVSSPSVVTQVLSMGWLVSDSTAEKIEFKEAIELRYWTVNSSSD